MRRAGLLAGLLAIVLGVAVAPTDRTTQAQANCFQESGFCISTAAFQEYFRLRGGVPTFGYPISREFTFLGFRVQFFQGHIMQLQPDGRVATMNLLQEGLMPATRVNGSVFPPPDAGLIAETPKVGEPNYAERIVEFTRRHAPNEWGGRPVRFFDTFLGTVDLATAFPSGGGSPALLPLLNLEMWGAVTSRPMADPTNPGFVYQRYQRSIMHYREVCRCTERILLADWFRAVITGQGLPPDLAEDMAASRFIHQYSPGAPNWLARPVELPGTDLTHAFTPDLPGFPAPAVPAPSAPAPTEPTATPIPPAPADAPPTVTMYLDDDRIDPGQAITVTIIARDDLGLDRLEFEGDAVDDNGNDNAAPAEDPALGPERRFDCEDRADCAAVFTVMPTTPGRFALVARARDTAGQGGEATVELRVRQGPTPTSTATAVPASPTPTYTPVPPTATPTATAAPLTPTPSATPTPAATSNPAQ